MADPIAFAGNPLDRQDAKRTDPEWIQARLADESTRILPVWKLSVLVRDEGTRLAWATPALLDGHSGEPPVFLGTRDGIAHFAVDLSASAEPLAEYGWAGMAEFPDLRAAAAVLPGEDAAIAAQARHVLDWHGRHGHCPGCGEKTVARNAGWSRWCSHCSSEHFPRTDPVVIMLVHDGERCLLGRQRGWPPGMFSALAGFVEAGETLEEAVAREVHEEAGIHVTDVSYTNSQPWPFPASLMLGCTARAENADIVIDPRELEAAEWFDRADARAALAAPTSRLAIPPPLAIAHHLIRAWAT